MGASGRVRSIKRLKTFTGNRKQHLKSQPSAQHIDVQQLIMKGESIDLMLSFVFIDVGVRVDVCVRFVKRREVEEERTVQANVIPRQAWQIDCVNNKQLNSNRQH